MLLDHYAASTFVVSNYVGRTLRGYLYAVRIIGNATELYVLTVSWLVSTAVDVQSKNNDTISAVASIAR